MQFLRGARGHAANLGGEEVRNFLGVLDSFTWVALGKWVDGGKPTPVAAKNESFFDEVAGQDPAR